MKISKLEKEYEKIEKLAQKEIKDHLNKAREELEKARQVSEKYGIPFNSNLFYVSNSYMPNSFQEKWKNLDQEFLEDIFYYKKEYDYDGEGFKLPRIGWLFSDFCN